MGRAQCEQRSIMSEGDAVFDEVAMDGDGDGVGDLVERMEVLLGEFAGLEAGDVEGADDASLDFEGEEEFGGETFFHEEPVGIEGEVFADVGSKEWFSFLEDGCDDGGSPGSCVLVGVFLDGSAGEGEGDFEALFLGVVEGDIEAVEGADGLEVLAEDVEDFLERDVGDGEFEESVDEGELLGFGFEFDEEPLVLAREVAEFFLEFFEGIVWMWGGIGHGGLLRSLHNFLELYSLRGLSDHRKG